MDESMTDSGNASVYGGAETSDSSTGVSIMNSSERSGGSSTSRFDVRRFFNSKQYSDIMLEFTCGDASVRIPSHKLVLSQSPFFERAMNIGMCEAENNYLVIRDVPPPVGLAITGFFYGLDFDIEEDHLLQLLITLDRLQICELVDETSERVKKLLNANNALKLATGIAEGCPSMHSCWIPICSAFISCHEDEIAETESFLDLDLDAVVFLVAVRDPPIFVSPISFVIRWLQKQQKTSAFLRDSLSKSSLTNNDKILSGILRDAIFSFDAFSTLVEHVGYDEAKKFMEVRTFKPFACLLLIASCRNILQTISLRSMLLHSSLQVSGYLLQRMMEMEMKVEVEKELKEMVMMMEVMMMVEVMLMLALALVPMIDN
eukprot:758394-Hanusia_phi.AAC.1